MREIKIEEPFYAVQISYFIGGSIPELNKVLKKRYGDDFDEQNDDTDAYQHHIIPAGGKDEIFFVWIGNPDMNLLWHETMHLAFDILRVRGIAYSERCEDAFAYLGGNIFQKLFKEGLQPTKIMV